MPKRSRKSQVAVDPEFVNDRVGAAVLSVSPRTFAQLVSRGDIARVQVPGMRRIVYSLAEIRALAARWRAGSANGTA